MTELEQYLEDEGWKKGQESWGKPHDILSMELEGYKSEQLFTGINPDRLSDYCLRTATQAAKIQRKVDSKNA